MISVDKLQIYVSFLLIFQIVDYCRRMYYICVVEMYHRVDSYAGGYGSISATPFAGMVR